MHLWLQSAWRDASTNPGILFIHYCDLDLRFSTWGNFTSKGTVWQCLDTSLVVTTGVGDNMGIFWVRTRGPTVHRTDPKTKDYLVPNVGSAEIEKL